VLHSIATAALKDISKPLQVGVDVGVRVGKRVSHASLRREVNNMLGFCLCKQSRHSGTVSNIQSMKSEIRK
jgi:hypothetical protein